MNTAEADKPTVRPGSTAALLIHGLGGTQFDLGSMHKALKRAGIDTHSLTLPGHGTTPEDLSGVRAEAWLDAVTKKYREVALAYDTVHVVGMCMGSLLAIALCAREGHSRGRLVTLAPPIFIDGWATPWYRGLRHLMYLLPFVPSRMRVDEDEPYGIKNALVRSIVKAKFDRGENFHYRWVPLACIREVDRLRRLAKRAATALRCETLVMHAREDELTSLKSADFLRGAVARSEVVVLENSYHLICVDNDRQTVTTNVLRFLGLDPAAADSPAEVEVDVPMSDAEVRDVAGRYMAAMTAQQFEAALPLFASDVVWEQHGTGPLAGEYAGRSALIDLFSALLDRSDGTFAVQSYGEPAFEGQTASADVLFVATRGGKPFHGAARQTFTFRNKRIVRVVYDPRDAEAEGAFWQSGEALVRAAGASGASHRSPPVSAALAALDGDALERRFAQSQAEVKSLARRPPNDVLLRLYACYKQAVEGDAPAQQPSALDPAGRAKHAAWTRLGGVGRDDARRRYVALADELAQAVVA